MTDEPERPKAEEKVIVEHLHTGVLATHLQRWLELRLLARRIQPPYTWRTWAGELDGRKVAAVACVAGPVNSAGNSAGEHHVAVAWSGYDALERSLGGTGRCLDVAAHHMSLRCRANELGVTGDWDHGIVDESKVTSFVLRHDGIEGPLLSLIRWAVR